MIDADHVVLLDDDGRAIGTAPKSSVHGTDTALHLAFSCHVMNDDGQVLVTRRALDKKTWPGVWSNSFCGHPKPAETVLAAVHRRARLDLGISLTDTARGRWRQRAGAGRRRGQRDPARSRIRSPRRGGRPFHPRGQAVPSGAGLG